MSHDYHMSLAKYSNKFHMIVNVAITDSNRMYVDKILQRWNSIMPAKFHIWECFAEDITFFFIYEIKLTLTLVDLQIITS